MIQRHLLCFDTHDDFNTCVRLSLSSLLKNYEPNQILGIHIFVDSKTRDDFSAKKETILFSFRQSFPTLPVSVISQPPKASIELEVWTHTSLQTLEYKSLNNFQYALFSDTRGTYVFALGIEASTYGLKLEQQSLAAFHGVEQILAAEGFSFDDLIRQWNYIPDIIERITDEGEHLQNYQIFNNIRERVYHSHKKSSSYPAATGIGVERGHVMIDFVAAKLHPQQQCSPLINPQQIDAFCYSQSQLIGSALDKKAPLFSRAMFVGNYKLAQVYVSGTASIVGEETVAVGDVAAQTRITMENIEKLISTENIFNATGFEFNDIGYSYARVYVKNKADFDTVTAICHKYFSSIPFSLVQADICRDHLLVEIECELICINHA